MMTVAQLSARVLADGLEHQLMHEVGTAVDAPEGAARVEVSATLMREIIRVLRGDG